MRASLTNESIDRACEEIERFLTKRGVERKERLRIKPGAGVNAALRTVTLFFCFR